MSLFKKFRGDHHYAPELFIPQNKIVATPLVSKHNFLLAWNR